LYGYISQRALFEGIENFAFLYTLPLNVAVESTGGLFDGRASLGGWEQRGRFYG